jgi:uncharacterized OsmC-like protein
VRWLRRGSTLYRGEACPGSYGLCLSFCLSDIFSKQEKTTVTTDQLRSLQAPLKQRYRDEPGAALITLRAQGKVGEGISCKIETGRALVEAGLHPASGGDGLAACSGDMLLEALVACAGVTLRAVATSIGVQVSDGTVTAEGDLDFRGTLGVSKEAPVGFQSIRLSFHLDTDATEEQLTTLLRLTERYCVVLQTLRQSPVLEASCFRREGLSQAQQSYPESPRQLEESS